MNLFSKSLILLALVTSFSSLALAQRIGEIDRDEKDRYETRYEAKSSSTIAFGPAWGSNLNRTDMLYAVSLGHEWQLKSQGGVFIEAKGAFGSSVTYLDALIGGKFYVTDTDVSPFLKGGLGFGVANGPGVDAKGGFAGSIGAGVAMFRTSSVHLEVTAAYSSIFNSNEKGTPGIGSLSLALHF